MAAAVTFGEAVARMRAMLDRDALTLDELAEARELLRAAAEIAEEYETSRRPLASIIDRQKGVLAELGGMLRARRRAARELEASSTDEALTHATPRRAR